MTDGISIGLTQGAQSANPTLDAYNTRTQQIAQTSLAQQKVQDDNTQRVFDLAAAGHTDEAKFVAQQKGLNIPDQIYQNGALVQSLSLAGKIHPDDPVAAQKFATAFSSTPGDFDTRVNTAMQAAPVTDPNDRKLQRDIQLARATSNIKATEPMTPYEQAQIANEREKNRQNSLDYGVTPVPQAPAAASPAPGAQPGNAGMNLAAADPLANSGTNLNNDTASINKAMGAEPSPAAAPVTGGPAAPPPSAGQPASGGAPEAAPPSSTVTPAAIPGATLPQDATGQAYIDSITNPHVRDAAQAYMEGRGAKPTARSLPYQKIGWEVALHADPTLNEATFPVRQKALVGFSSGPQGGVVNSVNTMIHHGDSFDTNLQKVGNRGSEWWNSMTNPLVAGTSDEFNALLKPVQADQTALTSEAAKTYKGQGGVATDGEIDKWIRPLSVNMGPQASKATVDEMIGGLLKGKLDGMKEQWQQAFPNDESNHYLDEESIAILKKRGIPIPDYAQGPYIPVRAGYTPGVHDANSVAPPAPPSDPADRYGLSPTPPAPAAGAPQKPAATPDATTQIPEGSAATNSLGHKIIFKGGQWTPL